MRRLAQRLASAALLALCACSEPASPPAPDQPADLAAAQDLSAAADLAPAADLSADLAPRQNPASLWLSFANDDRLNMVLVDDPNPPSF